jgi:hypothetical protein
VGEVAEVEVVVAHLTEGFGFDLERLRCHM